ncbi:MerR family transcriptional regulator [Acetobacter sp. TBRC 12305]|uniref:MerR family transcriptional regulator n=2 Tax=Acetobacter garciniae TaxID=2817435 RepID=A0A939HQY0_9PROT|nr:MerR family transcriptional regulator [Acetobacter garciniae]MBX0345806.1 MerR family transcriptional regulator [Acetobacter garciniae]
MMDRPDPVQGLLPPQPAESEDDSFDSARLEKGPLAFRTISEVADELHVPQHTLRLWETQFEAVRPLKRGGGRRYYRPGDVALLRRIADLLYTQGYTVKGVQRLLREGVIAVDTAEAGAESDGDYGTLLDTRDSAPTLAVPPAVLPPAPLPNTDIVQAVFDLESQETVVVDREPALSPASALQSAACDELRQELADILVELQAIRARLVG